MTWTSAADRLLEALGAQALAVIATFAVSGLVAAGRWYLFRRAPARRTFRYPRDPSVLIVASTSGPIQTEDYKRPTTGLGQVRAVLILSVLLRRGYGGLEVARFRLADEALGAEIGTNLLLLGGPKTNTVTRMMLHELAPQLPLKVSGEEIHWNGEVYTGQDDEGDVIVDYGFVVRAVNPFNPAARVVILGGSHTYGTTAAASWLASHGATRRLGENMVAVVRAGVVRGHVATPSLIGTPMRLSRTPVTTSAPESSRK